MNRSLVVVSVALAIGCGTKKSREAPAGSAVGSGTNAAIGSGASGGSGSAGSAVGSAGSAAGSGTTTGFARFDDAVAGTAPWITDDEAKAGIVELIAVDDLSGQTDGEFSTKRRCGEAAKQAVAGVGKGLLSRAKDTTYDPATCGELDGVFECTSAGVAEGDVVYAVEYKQTAGGFQLVGVKTYGVGLTIDKQEQQYKKLLATSCK